MYAQLSSKQLGEVRAFMRIDAVPDSEIEEQDRLEAQRRELSAKAKARFAQVFKQ